MSAQFCDIKHKTLGDCQGRAGHDGRHINVNGSWPQSPQQCRHPWHLTGLRGEGPHAVLSPSCPGCGTVRV